MTPRSRKATPEETAATNGQIDDYRPPDDSEGQDDNYDPLDPESHIVGRADDIPTGDSTIVVVRKPKPREFFMSHPDPAYRRDLDLYERKQGRDTEMYLPHRDFEALFEDELIPVRLILTINKIGSLFLCPIRIWGEENERLERLFKSAMKVVRESETHWTRRRYDDASGGYIGKPALGDLGTPEWPDVAFKELFRIAFTGKVVDREDHPVLDELRGKK